MLSVVVIILLYYGKSITQIYLDPLNLVTLQDGAGSSDEIREWRHNLFTNYRFDADSKLKGWTVGGGARWQDSVVSTRFGGFHRNAIGF